MDLGQPSSVQTYFLFLFLSRGRSPQEHEAPGATKGKQRTTGRVASSVDPGESAFLFETVLRDQRGVHAAVPWLPRADESEEKVNR